MNHNNPFFTRILSNRQVRFGIVLISISCFLSFITGGILSYLIRSEISPSIYLFIKFSPFLGVIAGAGYLIFGYLEGFDIKKNNSEIDASKVDMRYELEKLTELVLSLKKNQNTEVHNTDNITKSIQELNIQISDLNKLQFDDKQKDELFTSLKKSFGENINSEFFANLNENIALEVGKEKRDRIEIIFRETTQVKFRLLDEVGALGRRANLNLVIGSLTTIVALSTLSFIVFQSTSKFISWPETIYHYIPRISFIIFIEVFAYFFLKLYKSNLNDIKYYQNELTNVEMKLSAVITSINFGKEIDLTNVVTELLKTERNFILKKDESTVEIEKSKLDKEDLKDILKFTTDILKEKR